jgi:hypothetical protein
VQGFVQILENLSDFLQKERLDAGTQSRRNADASNFCLHGRGGRMQPTTTMAQTTCPHAHLRLLLPMRMSGLMNLLPSSYRTRNPVVVVPSRISSSVVPDLSLLSISSRKLARRRTRCRASVKAETGADDEQLETEEKEQRTTTQSTLSSFSPGLEKDLSKVCFPLQFFSPNASLCKLCEEPKSFRAFQDR